MHVFIKNIFKADFMTLIKIIELIAS